LHSHHICSSDGVTNTETEGQSKFLQNVQEECQYLEDPMKSIVPEHERIGELSACLGGYAGFASIVDDMTCTSKQLKSLLSFTGVMILKTLKEVQKQQVISANESSSSQSNCGVKCNPGGCVGKGGCSGRGQGRQSDVLIREENLF
jgi:hypothetical protein